MSATRQITETTVKNEDNGSDLVLRLAAQPSTSTATEPRRHVAWSTETVDNEHMGKKKSKCCCIYKKPKNWQDSSSGSDSDCETGHCRGHVEQKGGKKHDHSHEEHSKPTH